MICKKENFIGINRLADLLNVKPSSASKMTAQLRELQLVSAERYGKVHPTEEGWRYGDYLLYRHRVLSDFLCLVNHTCDELEQVERIEHFFDRRTVENIRLLTKRLQKEEQGLEEEEH